MKKVMNMTASDYTIQLDWSYVGIMIPDDQNRKTIPLLFLGVDQTRGLVLFQEMLPPAINKYTAVFNLIGRTIERTGKPKEIVVCEKELKNILEDFCHRTGIKLKTPRTLPELNRIRNMIIDTYIGRPCS